MATTDMTAESGRGVRPRASVRVKAGRSAGAGIGPRRRQRRSGMNPKRSLEQSPPKLPFSSTEWGWQLAGAALVTFGLAVLLSNLCGSG